MTMRRCIAFMLALFTLFLSTETSFMLHFCHNQFVAASVNKELSSCCMKKEQARPVFSGVCCELSSFDTQLNDTVIQENDLSCETPVLDQMVAVSALVEIRYDSFVYQHIPRPPPTRTNQKIHILYEQYLI